MSGFDTCPNPECPHLLRVGSPAEYEPGHTRCADCDAALVKGTQVVSSPLAGPRPRASPRSWGFTCSPSCSGRGR